MSSVKTTGDAFALGTFSTPGGTRFAGLVIQDRVAPLRELNGLCKRLALNLSGEDSVLNLLAAWDRNLQALQALAQFVASSRMSEAARAFVPLQELTVHAPVDLPRQIFCTVANYGGPLIEAALKQPALPDQQPLGEVERRAHVIQSLDERAATGTPYICVKLPSAVIGPYDPFVVPDYCRKSDWELELDVVIGRPARNVSRAEAMSHVAGYTIVNDMTARDLVTRADYPNLVSDWLRSKSAPGFLPMGPLLVPAAFVPNPHDLRLTLKLNGAVMQDGATSDMLFDIPCQIEYLSRHVQLWPGDVICTGTPGGSGVQHNRFLEPGDVLEATIAGLGAQRTPCVSKDACAGKGIE